MSMIKHLFCLIFLITGFLSFGQTNNGIIIPKFNDKYSDFVQQLETGNTDIDYTAFRNSFPDSKQFTVKSERRTEYDSLENEVYKAIKKSDYRQVIELTKSILSIDYTSMFAHKYLQQTYKILGDTLNKNKYHDIEFGLLYSIVNSGDGKTCETAWQVVQIEEEYFILDMLGADLQEQSISKSKKNICDRMKVKTDDGDAVYYFGVNKVFSKYPKK